MCDNCPNNPGPYPRTFEIEGRKLTACCNACENTLKGLCGEPWRFASQRDWEVFMVEHPDYDYTEDPDPRWTYL